MPIENVFYPAVRFVSQFEAAVRMGWDHWLLGERGREAKAAFVGMSGFGASAPAEQLYEEFGITAEATAKKVKSLL